MEKWGDMQEGSNECQKRKPSKNCPKGNLEQLLIMGGVKGVDSPGPGNDIKAKTGYRGGGGGACRRKRRPVQEKFNPKLFEYAETNTKTRKWGRTGKKPSTTVKGGAGGREKGRLTEILLAGESRNRDKDEGNVQMHGQKMSGRGRGGREKKC